MAYKQEQKDLKKPDEFQKLGDQAVPWLEQHGKTAVSIVVGTLGVGLVVTLVSHFSARGELDSSRELGAVLRVLEREVSEVVPAGKAAEEAPFKTETEKDEALIKSLIEFRQKHADRKSAASAALPLAQALIRQGKIDEALPHLDEYLKGGSLTDPLRPTAYEAKGYALEAQKKYDEALAAFDALAKENKTDFLKGMGQYHRARILLQKGDSVGAAKQFSEVETLAPGSSAAKLAKDRLLILASQGVAVPKPEAAPAAPTEPVQQ